MKVKIACPHNTVTGGIELLHQVATELNKYLSTDIWYVLDPVEKRIPSEYLAYGNTVNNTIESNDVLIFPEIWANYTNYSAYRHHRKFVFWEGVPAYFGHTPKENWFRFGEGTQHIVQTEYAGRFLNCLGINANLEITDYVNDAFLNCDIRGRREPIVLYNPVKGMEFTDKLIRLASDITFIPITGMTRAQILDFMKRSMVWVDFGDFPGKDKLPREAGACGMCLITSTHGSARYKKDLCIPDEFKVFDANFADLSLIIERIRDILEHFNDRQKLFEGYRERLKQEKEQFKDGIKQLAELLANEV